MLAQQAWARALRAAYYMVKFRVPYGDVDTALAAYRRAVPGGGAATRSRRLMYMRGDLLLQAYEPPMSAELRLVRAAGANGRLYTAAVDVSRVEQLMMAFNMLWRTHALYKGGAASYDVAAERSILAALPSGTAARALALIDEHRARVGKGDVSTCGARGVERAARHKLGAAPLGTLAQDLLESCGPDASAQKARGGRAVRSHRGRGRRAVPKRA